MLEAGEARTHSKLDVIPSAKARRKNIVSFRDLEVYQLSYELAMQIFEITRQFPSVENYALTRQLRNAARSVPANIAEGWSKRRYENIFKRQLVDALGSVDEVSVWMDMARDCGYCNAVKHDEIVRSYERLGKMLQRLIDNWRTF
jgi:four helix bundle protein